MKKKPMKSNKPKTNIPKSRKELRKESRKAKKVKKHEHYIKFHSKKNKQELGKGNDKNKAVFNKGKKIKNFNETHDNNNKMPFDETKSNKFQSIFDEHVREKSQEEAKKKKLEKQFQQNRLEKFKIENEEEEKVIKTLEKKLKLKKRKNKAAAFAMDGLDYVLGVCDKETFGDKSENNIYDSDSDFVSDLAVVSGKKVEKSKKEPKEKNKKQKDDDDNDDNSDVEGEEEFDESVAGEEDFNESDEEEEDFNESDEEQDDEEGKHEEDIDSSDFSVDSDPDDTVELPSNKIKKRKILKSAKLPSSKRKKQESESEEYDEFDSDENNEEAEDGDSNGGSSDDDSIIATEESLSDKKNEIKDNELTEDIYGRLKDKKGNLVSTYKPPQLRNAIANTPAGKNQEKLQKLRRQLKGLLNRLAENNMNSISNQIEQLYMSNSRNDMNETLCQLFHEALVSEVLTPERLVMEHAMLIAILHGNVGSEVSAHFLQHMVTHLDKLLKEDLNVEDKRVNNLLLFIMHLYNFRIFHSQLMYDIIDVLLEKLEEKQIELILLVFRTVGFALRKDDPVALKSLVLKVQDKANTISTDDKGSRVKFMLEMVLAIKNNNMSKIPNYNPEVVERLRKSLKMLIRKGNFTSELKISLKDLLNAEKHGRWWIVGSAWSGTAPTEHNANKAEEKSSVANTFSQKLLDLAKKQRMNTDVRRNIFCILMSAEDYLEAFEKLIKLGLKGAVEREIMNVLIHCALQEKQFNPYYYHLANKFCTFDRKYQMMLQYAVWDKIKDIDNLIPQQVTNLAKFLGSVILAKGLPISVLKVIQFAEMEKPSVKFIRQVLLTILLFDDQEEVAAVFRKISNSNKLKVFREGLRLFLHHFVLRNVKNATEENVKLLKKRVDLADKAMSASDLDLAF